MRQPQNPLSLIVHLRLRHEAVLRENAGDFLQACFAAQILHPRQRRGPTSAYVIGKEIVDHARFTGVLQTGGQFPQNIAFTIGKPRLRSVRQSVQDLRPAWAKP